MGWLNGREWTGFVVLVAIAVTTGCAGSTESVRAVRQHSREPADLELVSSRIASFEETLKTVNTLLLETPYTPGDTWIRELAITEGTAKEIEAELRSSTIYANPELRVPVARVYTTHVRRVLNKVNAGAKTTEPKYPNMVAALGDLGPGEGLTATWSTMAERREKMAETALLVEAKSDEVARARAAKKLTKEQAQELAVLQKTANDLEAAQEADSKTVTNSLKTLTLASIGEKAQVLEDMVTVVSVAARLDLEAAAMLTVVALQLPRAIGGGVNVNQVKGGAALVRDLPGRFDRSTVMIKDQVDVMVTAAETLATVKGIDLSDTPGFAYGETAAESVAGLALDSFYFDVNAGAEALFFNFAEQGEPSDEASITYDLSGRENALSYSVEPIVVAAFDLDFGFDYGGIANFLNLDAGYKTDRVYSSGGSIERSDEVFDELPVNDAVSDALGAGLAVAGVNARVTFARFTAGEVTRENLATGLTSSAPLQIQLTQIDLSYDLVFLLRDTAFAQWFDGLTVGGRYLDYQLPRIVYEFEDQNGDPDQDDYVYLRESPVQLVRTQAYMGGAVLRRGTVAGSGAGFILDLGAFAGAGPVTYTLDESEGEQNKTLFTFLLEAKLGYAYAFLSPSNSLQFDAVGTYGANVIVSSVVGETSGDGENDMGEKSVTFGGADIFHGPQISARLSF